MRQRNYLQIPRSASDSVANVSRLHELISILNSIATEVEYFHKSVVKSDVYRLDFRILNQERFEANTPTKPSNFVKSDFPKVT